MPITDTDMCCLQEEVFTGGDTNIEKSNVNKLNESYINEQMLRWRSKKKNIFYYFCHISEQS